MNASDNHKIFMNSYVKKQFVSTYTPNSELIAMLLRGTISQLTDGIMQQSVGWNPGDLLYKPVLQVRVGQFTVIESGVGLCA